MLAQAEAAPNHRGCTLTVSGIQNITNIGILRNKSQTSIRRLQGKHRTSMNTFSWSVEGKSFLTFVGQIWKSPPMDFEAVSFVFAIFSTLYVFSGTI